MGVHEGRARLGKIAKELAARWSETRMQWDDANARQFESKFMIPLEEDIRSAVGAMDHMGQVLHQLRRDCEE